MTDSDRILAFTAALLATGDQLRQVHDHMDAFAAAGLSKAAPPKDEVLMTLVSGILDEWLADASDEDLDAATRAVQRTADALAADLFLVPIDSMPIGE